MCDIRIYQKMKNEEEDHTESKSVDTEYDSIDEYVAEDPSENNNTDNEYDSIDEYVEEDPTTAPFLTLPINQQEATILHHKKEEEECQDQAFQFVDRQAARNLIALRQRRRETVASYYQRFLQEVHNLNEDENGNLITSLFIESLHEKSRVAVLRRERDRYLEGHVKLTMKDIVEIAAEAEI